jgi:hypothetical protein
LHTFAAASRGLDISAMLTAAWKTQGSRYPDAFRGPPKRLHIEPALDKAVPDLKTQLGALGIDVLIGHNKRLIAASKAQLQRDGLRDRASVDRRSRPGVLGDFFLDYMWWADGIEGSAYRAEPHRPWVGGKVSGLVVRDRGADPMGSVATKIGNTDRAEGTPPDELAGALDIRVSRGCRVSGSTRPRKNATLRTSVVAGVRRHWTRRVQGTQSRFAPRKCSPT